MLINSMKMPKIISVFLIFFLVGCVSEPDFSNRTIEKRSNITHAKHIVFIGFDGLGGFYIPKANMPVLKQMISEGSSCMNLYNVLPSMSWSNWSSLFFGAPPKIHSQENFPSIFDLVKYSASPGHNINSINAAFFYDWYEFDKIYSTVKEGRYIIDSSEKSAQNISEFIIKNRPKFTAIIFEEPDQTAHKKMWGSKKYYKMCVLLDNYLSIIKQSVIDAGIYNDTVFIISSDHGGFLHDHSLNYSRNRKIPLVVCGKGVKKNYTITSLSGICDIAPTMAAILGLDIPSQWTGIHLWEIFE